MTSLNIFQAIIKNDKLRFEQLIEEDENIVNEKSVVDMNTTLHIASKHGPLEIVQQIVKSRPCLVEALNSQRQTPVHVACIRGNIQILDTLLEVKPWVAHCLNNKRENAMFLSCKYGHVLLVRRLIESSFCFTPHLCYLDIAMAHGHQDVVQELIQSWPNLIEKVDENGLNLLHYACKYGEPKIARMLLKLNPDLVSTYDSSGFAPLHLTAIYGNNCEEIFQEFEVLAPHAFKALTRNHDTMLHLTARHNQFYTYLNLMHFLSDSDAHDLIQRRDPRGNTLLHVALSGGCTELAEYLISISTKEELLAKNDEGLSIDVGNFGATDSITLRLRDRLDNRWAELNNAVINSPSKTESVHRSQASYADDSYQSRSRESFLMTELERGESEHLEASYADDSYQSRSRESFRMTELERGESEHLEVSQAREESWQEIAKALHKVIEGGKQDRKSRRDEKMQEMHTEALQNARNTITIIAILISTVTFTGCLSPPGGFFQEGPLIGKPTMVRTTSFKVFSICNDVALFLSLGIVIVLVSIVPFRKKPLRKLIGVAHKVLCVAVGFMAVGYIAARWATTLHISYEKRMTKASLFACGVFLIVIFVGSGIMVINTKVKKRKWKRERKIIALTQNKKVIDNKRVNSKSKLINSKIEKKASNNKKLNNEKKLNKVPKFEEWTAYSVDSDMASSRRTGYHAY